MILSVRHLRVRFQYVVFFYIYVYHHPTTRCNLSQYAYKHVNINLNDKSALGSERRKEGVHRATTAFPPLVATNIFVQQYFHKWISILSGLILRGLSYLSISVFIVG